MIQNTRSRTPGRTMILVAALAAAGLVGSAHAGQITEIVAFGDSLSDVGNVYAATGQPVLSPLFPSDYSNGSNWVQLLAGKLGVAIPTASLLGGTDYAWGGAETGAGLSFLGTPNLGEQVAAFLGSNIPNAGQLFTIWAGANDFLNGGQTDPTVVVGNIAHAITELAGAGGVQFLVPGLPLLGELPATSIYPQPVRNDLDLLTLGFNGLLQAELANLSQSLGIDIAYLDINGTFQQIIADPSSFGLTNVTDSALAAGVPTGAGYLFWDTVHPTTAVHAVIAQQAFNAVVPEPSSIALLAISASALSVHGASRGMRRRKAA